MSKRASRKKIDGRWALIGGCWRRLRVFKHPQAPIARVAGARVICKWRWSARYRKEVTAQATALCRWWIESPPYCDDVPIKGVSARDMTERQKYIMRAAIAVLEAHGVDVSKTASCDPNDITRVVINFDKTGVSRIVNLAPRPLWQPKPVPMMQLDLFARISESESRKRFA